MRELNGIITTPVFRRGGTLLQRPGYDHELGVIYRPAGLGIPPVSADPGRAELAGAKARLLGLLRNFPFADPDLAKSVWLAAIFTRLTRFYFRGNVPMFLVSAGQKASGKGKLVDAATAIAEGAYALKCNVTNDDAELNRVIGAAIDDEVPVAVLDNIPRGVVLKSAAFESYLTTPTFTTRRVGTSDTIRSEKGGWNDTLWWATGNGLVTSGDMSRRVLRIDIDDKTGRPEDRRVDITDLEGYCLRNRPELLAAALTLLSGFFAAKRRGWRIELPPFASFEGWSVVREACVWCGLPDPFLARGREEDDEDGAAFPFLVEHLLSLTSGAETRVGHIVETLKKDHVAARPKHADAWNFLVDADVKLESPAGAAKSLGKFLHRFRGQVLPTRDGRRFQLKTRESKAGSFVRLDAVA